MAMAASNSSKVRSMGPSGFGSGSTFHPRTLAIRLMAVNPMRRHNRDWEDAVLGATARCRAAPSSTARRPTSQENHGSGDRNSNMTGYVGGLSAGSAAHCSQDE